MLYDYMKLTPLSSPNVCIALLRGHVPNEARFRVPLWFSKLDLRDYLWHAYGVEIFSVRSYVKQSRVQSGKPNEIRPPLRRWHRPKATKFMTVTLARPFVWPDPPANFEAWSKKEVELGEKDNEEFNERTGNLSDTWINEERRVRMREQAEALLQGKAQWKAPEDRWRFKTTMSRGQ